MATEYMDKRLEELIKEYNSVNGPNACMQAGLTFTDLLIWSARQRKPKQVPSFGEAMQAARLVGDALRNGS